jgi:4-amino-4-deoxy-L-arabinose transferase-like glycosyltransferase
MDKRRGDRLILLGLTVVVRLATAALIPRPGYMDTAYYTAGAVWMARGGGFSEPFIWNYLNNPAGIPHPGFLYWMPLPSLLGAPSAALFPRSFFALQIPFAILSAFVPLIAYGLAWRATGSRRLAWVAGLLAVFSGFFFPYWTLAETFAPFALFGSLALWLAGGWREDDGEGRTETATQSGSDGARDRGDQNSIGDGAHWLLVGALVGLAHLTRADGILLLPIVALAPFLTFSTLRFTFHISRNLLRQCLLIFLGYLLIMAPWFARNVAVIGTPLSAASTKTIWLTEYDDLFCYDCDLSLSSYLAWGWANILRSKLSALWINFQRLLAEEGLVFLLPFALAGFYRLRCRVSFLLASLYLGVIYLAHSLIFTFPGWRGGFFHASSAVLPFLYAAGMEGLDAAVRWVARQRRTWRYQQAQAVFAAAAVVVAVALSGAMAWRKIPEWRTADALYEEVDRWLKDQGALDAGLMVNNPPAFWYHTDRPAIVIPNGDVATLLEAADRYQMRYVLLESNRPAGLADLHAREVDHPWLQMLKMWPAEDALLYAVGP